METVTHEAILKRLVESEAGRKAAAAIQRDATSERVNTAANIEKLKRERGALAREHADAVEVARKRLEQARKAMTEAEAEHGRAAMAQAQHKAHYSSRISKLERELLATAPAAISEFLEWLADQESDCKGTAIVENAHKTDRISTHTSECVKQYFSNAKSLDARLKAIRAARAEAENLKPLILAAGDIEERLQALRDNLPAVVMAYSHER